MVGLYKFALLNTERISDNINPIGQREICPEVFIRQVASVCAFTNWGLSNKFASCFLNVVLLFSQILDFDGGFILLFFPQLKTKNHLIIVAVEQHAFVRGSSLLN